MKKTLFLLLMVAAALIVVGCSQDNPTEPVPMEDESAVLEDDSILDEDVALGEDKHWGGHRRMATYEVTIENLTPATGPGASQPFSPPILAVHRPGYHVFKRGRYASPELAGVAEDAQNGPLIDKLEGARRVHDVAAGGDVILPGGSMTLMVEAKARARFLSAVFMLVNTNDAFGGLDGVRLPRHGSRSFNVKAWDAGSEVNSELMSDIPGPCCGNPFMGTDERECISRHRGIMGNGDLDADTYGWDGTVAKVTVTRVD